MTWKSPEVAMIAGTTAAALVLIGVFIGIELEQWKDAPWESVKVPPGHVDVSRDRHGFYWTEQLGLARWNTCEKCHGNRWTQCGGASTPHKLLYCKDRLILRENPRGDDDHSPSESVP